MSELKQYLTKAQVTKLKQLTNDLEVDRVIGNRILVKVVEPYTEMDEVEKKGLLVIPEAVKDANTPMPTTGIIVAIGPPPAFIEQPLREGEMVMFSKFAGSECYFNNEHFRIMEAREVLCVLREREGSQMPAVVPVTEGEV